jgi:SNF2 family DNA or RNA helicase
MVFFSLPWSNELYTQAIGRLHRQGNDSRVTAHYIVGRNTIDEKVSRVLINKQNLQKELLGSIK